jgi:hypothetical protein
VQLSYQAYAGVAEPKIPEPNDALIAAAVEEAAKGAPKQTSPALFRKTVPVIIANWAKCGRNGGGGKSRKPPGWVSNEELDRAEARRKRIAEESA